MPSGAVHPNIRKSAESRYPGLDRVAQEIQCLRAFAVAPGLPVRLRHRICMASASTMFCGRWAMRRILLAVLIGIVAASPAAADGVLKIAVGVNLNTLDPARTTLGEEYIYDNLVFNGLVRMTPQMKIEPDLAESWDASEDLKTWTFHLRKGVKFHNGRALVADDVVKSFERILDPATGSSPRSNYMMIKQMTALDPSTVRFELEYGYSGFAEILVERQVKIVPADKVAELPTAPIGTGPFMFKSYTPGDRIVLARNPEYFEPGLPKLDGVEERIIPDMAVRIAAPGAGRGDYLLDLPPRQVEKLQAKPQPRVQSPTT